jgi:predicted MPP superfamily phosphohydrolase
LGITLKPIAKRVFSIMAAGFVIGLGLAIWAVLIEPGRITFREHPVYLKNWPPELAGFTIAFITDTHVGSPHITLDKMRDIVARTNALNPDLTLLGGDYIIQGVLGGHPVPSAEVVAVLSKLHARYGIFGVLGNHDWWDNAPRIHQEFQLQRVEMLEDTARHIQIDNNGFWLAGVSDYTEGAHDITKALSSVSGTEPVIVLTHSPDIFPEIPPRVALTLAGHTHGGQVWLPFLGRLVVPSKYGQRYAYGSILEHGKQLFVGAGIGTSILPIRFLTPPEVSILKLYPSRQP